MRNFWERNLRFKTDSSEDGPAKGAPAILRAGMMGDRAAVIFASPEEISGFISHACWASGRGHGASWSFLYRLRRRPRGEKRLVRPASRGSAGKQGALAFSQSAELSRLHALVAIIGFLCV
jgi:hypothetical protein